MKKVDQLKELTKEWSNGATMMAINEELHLAETTELKVELLQFKSEVLELSAYGKVHSVWVNDENCSQESDIYSQSTKEGKLDIHHSLKPCNSSQITKSNKNKSYQLSSAFAKSPSSPSTSNVVVTDVRVDTLIK